MAATGATLKEEYLFNHYWMGRRQIERGMAAEGGPFAHVLDPKASHDPSSVVEFMDLMSQSGIEFLLADEGFSAGGQDFPAGSYVLPKRSDPTWSISWSRRCFPTVASSRVVHRCPRTT